jgi:hypothetical protein
MSRNARSRETGGAEPSATVPLNIADVNAGAAIALAGNDPYLVNSP